ncbi:MAG: hypothetical protein ACI8S6_000641 [Myxococcota bacterium]|jgi:hypothetical protein
MSRLDLRTLAKPHQPTLPPVGSLRGPAIATWRGRMINEHESAVVFEVLAEQLEAADISARHIARCREFAAEERHHGALCGAVVEALGGEATAEVPPPEPVPRHEDASALEGALRNLLSICCLSETIAVALIGAEREEMPEGPLRELLTTIWADECGHANFGWRLLGELMPADPALKARLSEYLVVALAHLEAHELAHLPTQRFPAGAAALGLCGGPDARRLLYATVEQIILPGLDSHGLDATGAWQRRAEA